MFSVLTHKLNSHIHISAGKEIHIIVKYEILLISYCAASVVFGETEVQHPKSHASAADGDASSVMAVMACNECM